MNKCNHYLNYTIGNTCIIISLFIYSFSCLIMILSFIIYLFCIQIYVCLYFCCLFLILIFFFFTFLPSCLMKAFCLNTYPDIAQSDFGVDWFLGKGFIIQTCHSVFKAYEMFLLLVMWRTLCYKYELNGLVKSLTTMLKPWVYVETSSDLMQPCSKLLVFIQWWTNYSTIVLQ